MAVFTDIGSLNMRRRFAGGVRAVMTTHAIAGDTRMIKRCWDPACSGMTIVTIVAARNVRWVFAGSSIAVMTRAAGTQHVCVIDGKHGIKYICRVAVLADITGRYVLRAFANCLSAVVAAYAVASDVHVIEVRWQPASC